MWSYLLKFGGKNTTKAIILKTSKATNWTNISTSLFLVWSEKIIKNLNIQVLEVYFQVLIDIWKIANIPSVIEDVAFERKKKMQLKKESKGNRPKAAEALSDDEINIFYEINFLEFQTEQYW